MMHGKPGTRRDFLRVGSGLAMLGVSAPRLVWPQGGQEREVRLNGIRLLVQEPRVVAETTSGHCWYPDLLRFSTGELMLNHSLNLDANDNLHNSQAVYLSNDGGQTFPFAYDVNGFHNGCGEPRVSLPNGQIVGTSTFLKPEPAGQLRRFVAHRWTYERGGRRYSVEPWGASVEGLPRDVNPWDRPTRTWWARINWFSDILVLEDGSYLSTISLRYQGDQRHGTIAVVSQDQGRNWRYLSTVAGPDSVPDAKEGFDEPCLIRLADGDVMCVSRVGSGQDQKLARTYSSDGGKSWSELDRLPAFSVAPQMARLQNGLLALVTGRPGLFLWLSADPRGKQWQSFDLMAHHNAAVGEPSRIEAPQTSAYVAILEVSPNRVFVAYDRSPFGWEPVPADSGERSQIYLLEAGLERT